MSKTKTEAAETAAAAATETVSVPKAQFEQLLQDMQQMKEQLAQAKAPNERQEQQRLRDLEELERARAANAYAEELIPYHAETGSLKGNKNLEVCVNGEHYVIKRGETVKLPRKVVDVLENGKAQRARAYGLQDAKAEEFVKSAEQQAMQQAV